MIYLAFLAGFILGGLVGGIWSMWLVFRGMTNLAREIDRRPKADPPPPKDPPKPPVQSVSYGAPRAH